MAIDETEGHEEIGWYAGSDAEADSDE